MKSCVIFVSSSERGFRYEGRYALALRRAGYYIVNKTAKGLVRGGFGDYASF